MIAVLGLVVGVAFPATGTVLVGGRDWLWAMLIFGGLFGLAWFYRVLRPDPLIATGCEAAGQILLISGLFTLLTFAVTVAGAGFPWRDRLLDGWDVALGFDWRAYVAFVDARPAIQPVVLACYLAINWGFPVIFLGLVVTGDRVRLERTILAIWVSLALTTAIFFFMPAISAYAYYGVGLQDLHSLRPVLLLNQAVPLLREMRAAGPHVVRLDDLEGLVTFPSFHTIAAILFIWAAWANRWMRWPVLVVSLIMIAATPVEGAHYLVDLLAGAVVALVSIRCAVLLAPAVPAAMIRPALPEAAVAVRERS